MSLLRNAAHNLAGALLPALALLVTIPLVVHRMGSDAWGALVLITSIVGAFGVLDVNAAAAAVKYVSEHQARGDRQAAAAAARAGLGLQAAVGLVGALALLLLAPWLAGEAFAVGDRWRAEVEQALRWSGAAFLVTQLQLGLQAVPQGLQRFDVSSRYEALFGSAVPLATLGVVLAGGSLVAIVVARLLLGLLHLGLLARASQHLLPQLRSGAAGRFDWRPLAGYSLWAWLQRLAALLQANADKLIVGAQQSMTALAALAIPQALAGRLFGLLTRVLQVLFPHASALAARGQQPQLGATAVAVQRYALYLAVAACLLGALLARELLHHWLGGRADPASALVLVLVLYALVADAATQVPSLVVDGLGHPRLTALAATVRAVLTLPLGWLAVKLGGVTGLALLQLLMAWGAGAIFVVVAHRRVLPWRLGDTWRAAYGLNAGVLGVGSAVVAWHWQGPMLAAGPAVAVALALAAGLAAVGWVWVLEPADRARLSAALRSRR